MGLWSTPHLARALCDSEARPSPGSRVSAPRRGRRARAGPAEHAEGRARLSPHPTFPGSDRLTVREWGSPACRRGDGCRTRALPSKLLDLGAQRVWNVAGSFSAIDCGDEAASEERP